MDPVLTVRNLTKSFGRIRAIDGVTLNVHTGEILGLVGPNGAGKTTFFDLLMGDTRPDSGSVGLDGTDLSFLSTAMRCRLGLSRTFQTPRPFQHLTVYENILVAAVHGASNSQTEAAPKVHRAMELTGLEAKQDRFPGELTFVETKLLELARAAATGPKVLLLDEIGAGLMESEFDPIFDIVTALGSNGTGIIWVEHAMRMVTHCVTRLVVLAQGRILLSGKPSTVMTSREMYDVYLGEEA